jgi:hypothetical protein
MILLSAKAFAVKPTTQDTTSQAARHARPLRQFSREVAGRCSEEGTMGLDRHFCSNLDREAAGLGSVSSFRDSTA